ncbi:MAG: SurA N-terminal domain-containing protein [Clostridia bacterium]
MRNLTKIVIAAVFLLSALLTGCNMVKVNPEKDRAQVAARVYDEVITKGKVMDIYEAQRGNYGLGEDAEKDPELKERAKQLKESILDGLIERKVLEHVAEEMNLGLTEEEIKQIEEEANAALQGLKDSLIEQFRMEGEDDDAELEKKAEETMQTMLKQQGMDVDSMVEQYRQGHINQKLSESVRSKVKVTDDEVKKHYDDALKEQKDKFTKDPKAFEKAESSGEIILYQPAGFIRVKHILFKISDEDQKKIDELEEEKKTEEAKEHREKVIEMLKVKADAILDEIEAGVDFDKLVETTGEDPGMRDPRVKKKGYLLGEDSDFAPEFKEAALKLQNVGDMTGPVVTQFGVHIIKLVEKVPEGPIPFDEVKESLQKELQEEKEDKAWNDALEQWKKEANIKKYMNVF